MRLLILRKQLLTGDAPNYRGTARHSGGVDDGLPLDHSYNVAAFALIEAGGETGVLGDLAVARKIARGLRTRPRAEQIEIVELVSAGERPQAGRRFLGWDISGGGYGDSQLRFGLRGYGRDHRAQNLINVLETRYAPLLNGCGLFDDAETASACLDVLRGIEVAGPSAYEPTDGYMAVGLYACDE